ncbi:Manganese/iron superoxide dismutase [Astrocystis sublimbata]|nr:Manganese/iron superoxide dismutase [Astrocystis sublimbata]
MLRPRLRIPQAASALLRRSALGNRSMHSVPVLDQFSQSNDVPGLLSPLGYSTAWTTYMDHMVKRLNIMTAGTEYENQKPLHILKAAARDPADAATFNYASMVHNNHFFFTQLANLQTEHEQRADALGTPEAGAQMSPDERIPQRLVRVFETHFSSVETLRREFLATALGMFGPGFVWLVKNANSTEHRILATYLAGTPYTAAHWRAQGVDFNTATNDLGTVGAFMDRTQAGAGNGGGRFRAQAPGGTDVVPLLCLNTWEHVWLTDYGVAGKGAYVQNWWDTIDWAKVDNLAHPAKQDVFV